jgi:NAD(P)H dehydrogenase (quinone)
LEGLTAVSGQDIAAALAEALGRPVRYQTAPLAGVRAALTAGGLQLYQASHTISILSNVNAGMLAQRDGDLLALLAAPPRSVLDLITRELKASR